MEVSQWGLNSKNNQSRTGPGHSMVVSQWSSSEHRVLQSTWRASDHREVPAHGQRGGGESSCSYRFHGESPQRVTKPLTPQGLQTTRNLPVQASHKATQPWRRPAHRHASGPSKPKPARHVGQEMGVPKCKDLHGIHSQRRTARSPCALGARNRRRGRKHSCSTECAGASQNATLPDSKNHHHSPPMRTYSAPAKVVHEKVHKSAITGGA